LLEKAVFSPYAQSPDCIFKAPCAASLACSNLASLFIRSAKALSKSCDCNREACQAPLTQTADNAAADDGDFGRRKDETRSEYLKREYSALKPFVIISSSYLLFTTTDGAIRMIVLLHAYNLGFNAWLTAIMFTLYEVAGVVTNLAAGLMGARWGIKSTLLTGECLNFI
jgi:hypothetical protein